MLKVKHSFSRSQLEALESILQNITHLHFKRTDWKLCVVLLHKQWKKISIKLMDYKKKYTITFEPEVCLAFYLIFSEVNITTSFASAVLLQLMEKIKVTFDITSNQD